MRHRKTGEHAHVHSNEFDEEPENTDRRQVASKDGPIGRSASPPPTKNHRDRDQGDGLIELRRMDRNGCRRHAVRKRYGPRKLTGATVVIPDEKTSEAANRMSDRKGRGGRRQDREDRESATTHQPEAREESARETPEPAHAPSRKQKVSQGLLSEMLHHPKQLRAQEAACEAGHTCIHGVARQAGPSQLAAEQPEPDEGASRDKCTEARDFESPNAKENRVDSALPSVGDSPSVYVRYAD